MTAVYRCAQCLEVLEHVNRSSLSELALDHKSSIRIWFVDHNTYKGTYIRREVSKGEPTYWTLHHGDAERWCVVESSFLVGTYTSNA
jgi:hypothetical protein